MDAPYNPPREMMVKKAHVETAFKENVLAKGVMEETFRHEKLRNGAVKRSIEYDMHF